MKAYRAILTKLPKDKCDVEYIKRLTALTNLAYRGFEILVPDMLKNIQYQLYGFKNYMESLVFGTEPKRWFAETWVPLKTLRIYGNGSMKGNRSAPVVLDFRDNVIRLRQVCWNEPRYAVELPMPSWVVERLKEGGDIKFAMIGLKDNKPYLALIAEREVELYQPGEYVLVVDVNSWKYGIAWGLIRNGKLITWKTEKPDTFLINTLYHQTIERERKVGKLKTLGYSGSARVDEIKEQAHTRRSKIYRVTRDKAYFLASKLVKKALKYRASLIIDDMTEESRKELLEEGLPRDVVKLLMSNLKRFVHQLETLAQWYGVPYEFKRLYSKKCPVCGHELTQLPGRIMVCENCGFKAPRDKVPMYWALIKIKLLPTPKRDKISQDV
ncbi:MAG: transposase [Vulcanisaeta sp.]|nr:transposase [Vulcanisaeta sp.]